MAVHYYVLNIPTADDLPMWITHSHHNSYDEAFEMAVAIGAESYQIHEHDASGKRVG